MRLADSIVVRQDLRPQPVIQPLCSDCQQIHAQPREKCLVDIGSFVVPDAQTSKLIQPGERPLNDPPPPPKTTAVPGAAHGQQRQNVPRAQAVPDGGRIIAAVADHTGRPAARAAAVALQRRNRIHQGKGFLRVVPVGAGEAHRERDALSITDQMPFAPSFGAVGRIRTCLRSATYSAHGTTVHDGP